LFGGGFTASPYFLIGYYYFSRSCNTLKSEHDVFAEFLRSKGLKNTPERRQILEAVFSMHNHFEVDELLIKMRQTYKKRVSKATIYRSLPLLVECGLIREAIFMDKHTHYEHIFGHSEHEHIVCINCRKIVEFADKSLQLALEEVAEKYNFRKLSHKLEIDGLCEECSKDV